MPVGHAWTINSGATTGLDAHIDVEHDLHR